MTAEAVGLSESAVLRRLRRLRAQGVIVADVAVIDPARVEPRIVLHVQVEMNTQERRTAEAFKRALKASPFWKNCRKAWELIPGPSRRPTPTRWKTRPSWATRG